MSIKEKLFMDRYGLLEKGAITIVAFGDSVTHGILSNGEINYETVWWNRLRQKILSIRDYVPINVINSGIEGTTAKMAVDRIESQVVCHNPDLVVICFGLNDIAGTLEDYIESLKEIFEKCLRSNADVIFMTPNMLNTYVAEDTHPDYRAMAERTSNHQNSGKMDLYISSAVKLAQDMNVTVCDCYSEWKKLSETEDTTKLLCNRINHPAKEMHALFADMLFDIIAKDIPLQEELGRKE